MSNQTLNLSLKSSSRMKGFYSEIWLNVQKNIAKSLNLTEKLNISQIKECQKSSGLYDPKKVLVYMTPIYCKFQYKVQVCKRSG